MGTEKAEGTAKKKKKTATDTANHKGTKSTKKRRKNNNGNGDDVWAVSEPPKRKTAGKVKGGESVVLAFPKKARARAAFVLAEMTDGTWRAGCDLELTGTAAGCFVYSDRPRPMSRSFATRGEAIESALLLAHNHFQTARDQASAKAVRTRCTLVLAEIAERLDVVRAGMLPAAGTLDAAPEGEA